MISLNHPSTECVDLFYQKANLCLMKREEFNQVFNGFL